jgi:hypothetical protein
MDANITHQRNLTGRRLCMIVLHAPNSRYETLQPLLPGIRRALAQASPGTVLHVTA